MIQSDEDAERKKFFNKLDAISRALCWTAFILFVLTCWAQIFMRYFQEALDVP